jgi:hypothetical protein
MAIPLQPPTSSPDYFAMGWTIQILKYECSAKEELSARPNTGLDTVQEFVSQHGFSTVKNSGQHDRG